MRSSAASKSSARRPSGFPAAFRNANPQIPWRDMSAMRDRVIHGYDRVDVERVFDAVSIRMPALLPELRRLLDSLPEPD
jgi:uncharacterized protein with HEPN domain